MKSIYLLVLIFTLILDGCSDFSSDSSEFELSGKMYACDGNTQGDIIDDKKAGQKLYCNGYNWINLIPEDSIAQSPSDSENMYECKNGAIVKFKSLCSEQINNYLPLDDSEYPYAGIPRIVIETENHREIKDRETEIPAKLQIWGKDTPESEIMELTIRGRGNTSWTDMPKKSYKIEFQKKQEILGMSKDRDWALIANYADKTLMKNYLIYQLSSTLNMPYTPKSQFVELFMNKEYLGVYLLVETLKVSKHRINIPKDSSSFLMEFDVKDRKQEQHFETSLGLSIRLHYPQKTDSTTIILLKEHIDSLELFLERDLSANYSVLSKWIDVQTYLNYFLIQEFTKNSDASFYTSVFLTYTKGKPIQMGPVWDYDVTFGGHRREDIQSPFSWQTLDDYWNHYLFTNKTFIAESKAFWDKKREQYYYTIDSISKYQDFLSKAAKNNFKKWDILNSTAIKWHPYAYSDYNEAVDDLKKWISNRLKWIDQEVKKN